LELILELEAAGEAGGPLTDLGTGSGVLAIAAAKLGWDPVCGYDHEPASIEAATANATANGVTAAFKLTNLREGLPDLAPTVVANLTAPVLNEVADQLANSTLVCSGLLPSELDEIVSAFASCGLAEAERRHDGDWAALLLRRR
jgi:ribosomal protein L11 methyltransferase